MFRSRLGLKVLGLCALVLGLMAFANSAAQAEPGSTWSVINTKATPELLLIPGANDLLPQLALEVENNTIELLFTTAGGTKVAVLCTSVNFAAVGGRLQANGGISLGRVIATGCITKLNGVTSAACKPSGGGTIITEALNGLIVLDEVGGVKEDYVKITPENAASLTSKLFSKIELGLECSIGEFINVEARTLGDGLWIKDCPEGFTSKARALEYRVTHLLEQALGGETSTLIALGRNATIDGSVNARLTGEHLGFKFRGTWN